MKKYSLCLSLCSALALGLAGCTSQLYIHTIKPAVVDISYDQWKVVAVNRFNPDHLPFEREKKVEVYADGAQEAFNGALDAILEDSTYWLVHADTARYKTRTPEEPLTMEQLQEIYREHPFHLLLSLDYFDIGFEQETERTENQDGSVSKTAHYTLVTTSGWTLYDSLGNVLDRVSLSQDEFYQSRFVLSGLLAIGPAIGNAGPAVNKMAWYTGYDYWQRLSPQPYTYMRPYYSMKNLEPAAYRMAAEDWEGAISLLIPLTEGPKKEAAKAAYNLAVVYEAMGRPDEARFWAKEAARKNNRLALLLLEELDR